MNLLRYLQYFGFHYLLPTTYYLLPTTCYYLIPTTRLRYYLLYSTTSCLLPTAYYLLHTKYYLLPTTYYDTCYTYLLHTVPTTYYLLPAATYYILYYCTYYLLPTTYYLLASTDRRRLQLGSWPSLLGRVPPLGLIYTSNKVKNRTKPTYCLQYRTRTVSIHHTRTRINQV